MTDITVWIGIAGETIAVAFLSILHYLPHPPSLTRRKFSEGVFAEDLFKVKNNGLDFNEYYENFLGLRAYSFWLIFSVFWLLEVSSVVVWGITPFLYAVPILFFGVPIHYGVRSRRKIGRSEQVFEEYVSSGEIPTIPALKRRILMSSVVRKLVAFNLWGLIFIVGLTFVLGAVLPEPLVYQSPVFILFALFFYAVIFGSLSAPYRDFRWLNRSWILDNILRDNKVDVQIHLDIAGSSVFRPLTGQLITARPQIMVSRFEKENIWKEIVEWKQIGRISLHITPNNRNLQDQEV